MSRDHKTCKTAILILLVAFLSGCAGWTKTEKVMAVGAVVMTGADAYLTNEGINVKGGYKETGPGLGGLYGEYPSTAEIITFWATKNAIGLALQYIFPDHKKWFSGSLITAGTIGAVNNYTVMH